MLKSRFPALTTKTFETQFQLFDALQRNECDGTLVPQLAYDMNAMAAVGVRGTEKTKYCNLKAVGAPVINVPTEMPGDGHSTTGFCIYSDSAPCDVITMHCTKM